MHIALPHELDKSKMELKLGETYIQDVEKNYPINAVFPHKFETSKQRKETEKKGDTQKLGFSLVE